MTNIFRILHNMGFRWSRTQITGPKLGQVPSICATYSK